jgi:hypothetical protein
MYHRQILQAVVAPMSDEDRKMQNDEKTCEMLCLVGVVLFIIGFFFHICGYISFFVNIVNVCMFNGNHPSAKVKRLVCGFFPVFSRFFPNSD